MLLTAFKRLSTRDAQPSTLEEHMNSLARAARRLASPSGRGLGDALGDAGLAGTSGRAWKGLQQPWALTSLRAHAATAAPEDEAGPSTSGSRQLGLEEAAQAGGSGSGKAAAEAAAVALQGTRTKPPPGHTDFEQRQLLMLFTCTKCNTRAAKAFSKQSYESGVVIVECPGCSSKHLIADHLGWFGQKGTVEEFAAEKGRMVVRKLADGTVELTPEDLLGASLVQEAAAATAASGGGGDAGGGTSGGGDGAGGSAGGSAATSS